MIPLAFNFDGEAFDPPPNSTDWRVKRLRTGKGAPEVVYNTEGVPLVVPIDIDADVFRETVGAPGKYRLDPVDDQHRVIKGAEAAYVLVRPSGATRTGTAVEAVPEEATGTVSAVLTEALRQNAEMARNSNELAQAIIHRFPAMLGASAEVLRAAHGAGLTRAPAIDIEAAVELDGEDEAQADAQGFNLQALLVQLAPMLVSLLTSKGIKLPGLDEMLDWRKAAAKRAAETARGAAPRSAGRSSTSTGTSARRSSTTSASSSPAAERASADDATEPTASAPESADLPPLTPEAIAHFLAIQSALSPKDAALARAAAAELSPTDLRAWFDELSELSVADAVARVQELLRGGNATDGTTSGTGDL